MSGLVGFFSPVVEDSISSFSGADAAKSALPSASTTRLSSPSGVFSAALETSSGFRASARHNGKTAKNGYYEELPNIRRVLPPILDAEIEA